MTDPSTFQKRFRQMFGEHYRCWKFVAYDHEGEMHVSQYGKDRMEHDALQEALRTVFRECEEPINVVENARVFRDDDDDGEDDSDSPPIPEDS